MYHASSAQIVVNFGLCFLHVCICCFQLENLMYYNQNNRSKVVLRDFYLSRFENGTITEPCGTPEYLGMYELSFPPRAGTELRCSSSFSHPHSLTWSWYYYIKRTL